MTTREATRIRAASTLLDNLATKIDLALDHIRDELATQHDSYPTQAPGAAAPTADGPTVVRVCPSCEGEGCDDCGPVETTAVERAVFARHQLENQREQIRDDVTAIVRILESCYRTCDHIIATRLPPPKPMEKGLCYADPGKAGYMVPLADGGWHDPTCNNLSRTFKPGPCDRCAKAEQRWRAKAEQKPLVDDRPVTHDSLTFTTDNGVAHTRPIQGAA